MEIAEWQRDGISEMMIPQTAQLDAGPGSRPGASGGPVTLPSAPLFRHGQKGLGQKVHSSTPKVPSCGRRLAFIKNRLRHATPASRRVKSSNFSHSGNNATPQSRDQWHKRNTRLISSVAPSFWMRVKRPVSICSTFRAIADRFIT